VLEVLLTLLLSVANTVSNTQQTTFSVTISDERGYETDCAADAAQLFYILTQAGRQRLN